MRRALEFAYNHYANLSPVFSLQRFIFDLAFKRDRFSLTFPSSIIVVIYRNVF